MEQSQHIKALYQKYLDNDYSEQELDELLEYFYDSGEHHELSSMIREELANEKNGNKSHEEVQVLLAELDVELFEELAKRKTITKRVKLWPRIAAVSAAWKIAAAVAAITLGVWLYYASGLFGGRHPELVSGSPLANDIAPGKNTATITLANGEIINLSDAKNGVIVGSDLRYNDGSAVANLSPSGREGVAREGSNNNPLPPQWGSLPGGERSRVQTLTASTPRGGTYQVTLPDGTRVWLNADSRISFPSQFYGKQRKILLSGEAYFEVSKNKRMPFIVESNGQQVEVLGTHFNITAYNDETSTKTTLLEGSVRVAFGSPSASGSSLPLGEMASAREGSIVLKPNQQAILSGDNRIAVKEVDVNEVVAWRNGKFTFKNASLDQVMRQLARWYDVDIVYPDGVPERKFTGDIYRNINASEALDILKFTKVNFRIAGKKIIVEK